MKIQKLILYTSYLKEQKEFYSKILGFKVDQECLNSVSFHIGHSLLEFQKREISSQYHFAFNIPSNKEQEALLWLKQRVEILKDGESEIQDFKFWNAKAIYFYDYDKNIVEFISRKNLNNDALIPFDINQVLEICEIGLSTSNIEKVFDFIYEKANVPIYSGGMERFCSQGNEHGLFIIIDKNCKKWFPTNDDAISADFELIFEEKGTIHHLIYSKEKLQFSS